MTQQKTPKHVEFLRSLLEERLKLNRRYSSRALARDFDIHPSSLCRILSGTQLLSVGSALKILEILNLETKERDEFCRSICDERSRELQKAFGITNAIKSEAEKS